jgi:diamine N-acetyltransferase
MEIIEVKSASPDDIDKLQNIGRLTFSETFSPWNSKEDMDKYLREEFSREKLAAELSNKNSRFYFATLGNNIIGYLKLNFGQSQTELQDNDAIEIQRIYVLKEYHGKNVGQILCDKAISIARQENVEYVWLGVWGNNRRAVRFYKKNGFTEFDRHIFKLGNKEQTDLLMKLQLKNS